MKQLDEQRNQFVEQQRNQNVEQQRQYSTNMPVEQTVGDAQRVTVRGQRVDDMVRFQTVLITNMVRDKEIEINGNILVPSEEMYTRHRKFRERIDQFAEVQMCHVCQESYAGVHIRNTSTGPMCLRCLREGSNHRFSAASHMDPGFQPRLLQDIT